PFANHDKNPSPKLMQVSQLAFVARCSSIVPLRVPPGPPPSLRPRSPSRAASPRPGSVGTWPRHLLVRPMQVSWATRPSPTGALKRHSTLPPAHKAPSWSHWVCPGTLRPLGRTSPQLQFKTLLSKPVLLVSPRFCVG